MKRLILFASIIFLGISANAQIDVTFGMTGAQLRNALNQNFDSIFQGNMRHGVEIGGYRQNNRIDSVVVNGATVKFYHGTTILNTGGGNINVKDYGALGNNSADDRAAIIRAFDAAKAINGTVFFPSGTYLISSGISTNLSNTNIIIEGDGNAKIKIPSGGATLTFTTTADAHDHFKSIPGTSMIYVTVKRIAPTTTKGDMLMIKSTQRYANEGVSNNNKGEIVFVQNIIGDTLFLTRPLFDWYDTTMTTIERVNAGSVHLNNMKFEDIKVNFTGMRNSTITNCEWTNPYIGAIETSNCSHLYIANNFISRNAASPPYTQYGVGIGGSQNVTFTYNHVDNYSQQIATGGIYPTRFITYSYNTFRGDDYTGGDVDTHTDVQFGQIIGNFITDGGIYAGGEYIDIKDNTIQFSQPRYSRTGIIRFREDLTDIPGRPFHIERQESITGNRIIAIPNAFGFVEYTHGIMFTMSTNRDTIDYLSISDNYIDVGGYGIWMYADNYNADHIRTLVVRNNYVRSWGYASAPAINSSYNQTYSNVIIKDNEFESTTMRPATLAIRAAKLTVEGNIFRSVGAASLSRAVYVRYPNYVKFYNNNFENTILDLEYNISDEAVIEKNTFWGLAPATAPILAGQDATIPKITLIDNIYKTGCTVCVLTYWGTGLIVRDKKYLSAALTDGAPTAAEVNSACGSTPAGLFNGCTLIIKDTNGSGLTYTFVSDGTSWIMQGLPVKLL